MQHQRRAALRGRIAAAWIALAAILPIILAACNNQGGGPGY